MKPSVHLLYLLGLTALIGIATIEVWIWVLGSVFAVAIADLILYRLNVPELSVERMVTSQLAIHRQNTIRVKIHNQSAVPWRIKVFDDCPAEFHSDASVEYVQLGAQHEMLHEYNIRPIERGRFLISTTTLVVRSLLQLWEFKRTYSVDSEIKVYPDFATITRYLELSAVQNTIQTGIKLVARRGAGLEFEQLRDYRFGDAINQVDWNSTAKHQKLISREFQDERDQMICVLLDSGMTMQMRDDELTSFDHALNALILLSYVALRQGDSILVQFFGHSKKTIAPLKGVTSINTLLNAIFEERSGPVSTDYIEAAETLLEKQRRRSLVLFITNTRGKAADLPDALKLLSARHLTILVNLRDRTLDRIANQSVSTLDEALMTSESAYFMQDRKQIRSHCAQVCHDTVDCTPTQLLVHLINAYFRVKRSGAL